MTIKDIAVCAFKLLGRSDIAVALSAGSELDNESAEKTEALVYCINAVEDELARYYFPAKWTEELRSADGKFYFKKVFLLNLLMKAVYSSSPGLNTFT